MGQATKPPEKDAPAAGQFTGDPLYSPDELSSTRMREQGLGMGADELRLQRDPGGGMTVEGREATGTSAWDESETDHAETGGDSRSDRRH